MFAKLLIIRPLQSIQAKFAFSFPSHKRKTAEGEDKRCGARGVLQRGDTALARAISEGDTAGLRSNAEHTLLVCAALAAYTAWPQHSKDLMSLTPLRRLTNVCLERFRVSNVLYLICPF